MLKDLGAPNGAQVVMDAGIATEANLIWLREYGFRYLVVSRERARQFEAETPHPDKPPLAAPFTSNALTTWTTRKSASTVIPNNASKKNKE